MRLLRYCGLVTGLLLLGEDARGQGSPNGPVPGITDTYNHYQAIDLNVSLSSSAETLTIQQPASPANTAVFESLWVRCSTSCSFTLYEYGTKATSTTLATVPLNVAPIGSLQAWSASNSTLSAAKVLGTYYLEAAGTYVLDMSKFYLQLVAAQNLSIKTSSITGEVTITVQWIEK